MPAPIRLIFSGGPIAELLTIIPQLRRVTFCSIGEDSAFLFYQGFLLGGTMTEDRLARLLEQPEASAEIVSSDRLDDLVEDAPSINNIILDILRKKDEGKK